MISVKFNPESLSGKQKECWEAWQIEAEIATEEAIRAWENWKRQQDSGRKFQCRFREEVWKDLKDWLLEHVFHDKCAYCETKYIRSSYDADHFRPKGRVRIKRQGNRRLSVVTVTDRENTIEHPGYFWLAYHWANILPSCKRCNTSKVDQFPVRKIHCAVVHLDNGQDAIKFHQPRISQVGDNNFYFLQPSDLDELEDPLLLHPYVDNPQEYIIFDELGFVAAVDNNDKGKNSINLYNLDTEVLRDARCIEQRRALNTILMIIANPEPITERLAEQERLKERIARAEKYISKYINGEKPYSAAVLWYLRHFAVQALMTFFAVKLLTSSDLIKILKELLKSKPGFKELLQELLKSEPGF